MGNLIKETPYSEITATLEVLDKLGVERKHLHLIRVSQEQAERVAKVVRSWPPLTCKHCGSTRLEPDPGGYYRDAVDAEGGSYLCSDDCQDTNKRRSTTPELAKKIMDRNMIDVSLVERHLGVRFSVEEKYSLLKTIPWSEQVLWECKYTHILFPGYPLTILDIRDKAPKGTFYSPATNTECGDQNFTREGKVALRWYLIRKEAVRGSFSKTYTQQIKLLQQIEPLNDSEEVPMAVEVVYMATLYYLVNNIRLFGDYYVRCRDLDSRGCRVYVGSFDHGGLSVDDDWTNSFRHYIGLAASRKPNK